MFCAFMQSPEKYVLKFATGTLPKESKRYTIDYQFADGSVKTNIPVETLGPDVLLVCHPGLYVNTYGMCKCYKVVCDLCDSYKETL